MKKSIIPFFVALLFLTFTSCDDAQDADQDTNTDVTNQSDEENGDSKTDLSASNTYYVLAEKGLTMREEPNLDSKKLEVVNYGLAVQVIAEDAHAISPVGGLTGKMVKVIHGDNEGYMFDGYLSSIPVPLKNQGVEEYVKSLKRKSLSADNRYEDENEMSAAEVVSIPAASFQEALLIGQRLGLLSISFDIPNKNAKQMQFQLNGKTNTAKRNFEDDQHGKYVFTANKIDSGNENSMAASYYFFNIGFTDGDQGYEKLMASTAYEGGSWTCTLEKKDGNYVFTKTSTAD